MPATTTVSEAVYQARNALGTVPPQEMVAWIAATYGLTVKPVIVTVMLGTLEEKEHLARSAQQALERLANEQSKEPAEKPKRPRKAKKEKATLQAQSDATSISETSQELTAQKGTAGQRCSDCGSQDYVFRGRKWLRANPAVGQDAAVETKYTCRSCGHNWKTRLPTAESTGQ